MQTGKLKLPVWSCLTLILAVCQTFAQNQKTITPPRIGEYTVGDDYFLANYTQLLDYWNKVAKESDRMRHGCAATAPQLQRFVEEGGTLLAIGPSTGFNHYFGLPLSDALTDTSTDGGGGRLPNTKFYIPGSVLQAAVDTSLPIAYGLPDKVDVFYANSPAFRLQPGAEQKGTRPIVWFAGPEPLRSGWAWGQRYLDGAVGGVEAGVGKGKIYLFGPEIVFRAQPHGTFKFLFNAIYLSGAVPVTLP